MMVTSLTCLTVACLTLAQADSLNLTGARQTHGILGPVRTDNNLLPGDSLHVAFDVEGAAADSDGKLRYSTTTEVTDGQGKVVFRSPGREQASVHVLGGNRIPAYARVDVGLEQPAGDYTLKVTATDLVSKQSKTLTREFTVLPKGFGLVGLGLTSDADGRVPAGQVGVGETVYVHAAAVGFARPNGQGHPRLDFALRVLDESGKEAQSPPLTGSVEKDVPASAGSVPVQFALSLNRPGKFTVEIQAADRVGDKKFVRSFPLTVHPSN
jgi:hypothetical protein